MTCPRIEKPQFGTTPAEIVYTVDAADLKEGTVIQGQFYIVSSAGEKSVSYEYTVEAQKVMTSMGAAGSMFHFGQSCTDFTGGGSRLFFIAGF